MIVVSLFLILIFSIGVSASINYDRQEADACITIGERLSVKGGSDVNTDFVVSPNGVVIDSKTGIESIPETTFTTSKLQHEFRHAIDFETKQSSNIIQAENGPNLYRFDPTTNEIFVGTLSSGKIETYYMWDGRTDDAVINYLAETGLWN